jgi:transcriptional regulator with XRE-family HTH domain
VSPTRWQSSADRRTRDLRRGIVEQLVRLRDDAGISAHELAAAAGMFDGYVARIVAGAERPTLEAYGRLAAVLGADLSVRLYPNTGPAIRDRHQAPILYCHLGNATRPGARSPRSPFRRPSRGWIDVGLHEPRERIIVATEIQGALARMEQLIRWSAAKPGSVPSWDGWAPPGESPEISRLLVVRRTRATRQIAAEFASQLRVATPPNPTMR